MKKKQELLYNLPDMAYTPGTDLLIRSGQLSRDRKSGSLYCTLDFQVLADQGPKEVTVLLSFYDVEGCQNGDQFTYTYSVPEMQRDGRFGDRDEIPVPTPDAVSFSACVTAVTDPDGGESVFGEADMLPLSGPRTLEEAYEDAELAEQFRVRYGDDCRYACESEADLWFCACGAVNHESEKSCHRCSRLKKAMSGVNVDSLRAEVAAYVRSTRQDSELEQEKEQDPEEPETESGKKPRRSRLLIFLIPVVFVLILAIAAIPGAVQREQKYRKAVEAMKAGELDAAEEMLQEIPSYRDSNRLMNLQLPYLRACELMDAAKAGDESALADAGYSKGDINEENTVQMLLYTAAGDAFQALGDYEDSAARAAACRSAVEAEVERLEAEAAKKRAEELALKQAEYDRAAELLETGFYGEAAAAFEQLGDFSDSAEMITECQYQKALSLFRFLSAYDVSRISAKIGVGTDDYSIFSMPNSEALRLGSGCIDELRAACGGDPVDIRMEDEPSGNLVSLKDALTEFFVSLDGYADSEDYPAQIEEKTDYTKEFFMLCEAGDLYGAQQWLLGYGGVFPEREKWQQLLTTYMPYCGIWVLSSGDPNLLSKTYGGDFECMYVMSRVLLTKDENLTMRLSFGDNNSLTLDLPVEYGDRGEIRFVNRELMTGNYRVCINAIGHLTFERFDGDWNRMGASEYERT
ncbi:MAG: hypothetical protein K6C12_12330 [Oscillospiraceae bacterium]|nr:hypothetical protein [Oscillospiraceae bacterium]